MINPAGQECRFYYQDFHRGRSEQECRLVMKNGESADWREVIVLYVRFPKSCVPTAVRTS